MAIYFAIRGAESVRPCGYDLCESCWKSAADSRAVTAGFKDASFELTAAVIQEIMEETPEPRDDEGDFEPAWKILGLADLPQEMNPPPAPKSQVGAPARHYLQRVRKGY